MLKILYVLTATLNGELYVIDEGMTGPDCLAALEIQAAGHILPVGDSEWISNDGAFYACESMTPARGKWPANR